MILQEFYDGKAFDAYEYFGAHIEKSGVVFRTYAPQAERVSLIGDFNGWTEENMPQIEKSGVFEIKSALAKEGMMYKYIIHTKDGKSVEHCDPYGFGMELRPKFASIIRKLKSFRWTDSKWLEKRSKNYNKPMNIYEIHLGSWHKNPENETGFFSYSEIADKLIKYLKENGYTHVEFMPLSEHPADISWGYQNTGFYSPTSRYGTAKDLMTLINKLHKADIGSIIDFVPVHFAIDDYGLGRYDGTALYEYPHDMGYSEWGTMNFNYARREAVCFTQSCANYWLKEYHFDGIRMDAISRAIYWQGDPRRGVNNINVEFIQKMNSGLHRLHPTAMLIAEDSTSYLKITAPVEYDGLGFDYKWDLGWMNDTLDFFRLPPENRPEHYYKLIFSMDYFYNELFILPFSHDEVVHGKATIIQKMWGDYEEKFPQCRALFLYMYSHPGKKLNFMGNEFAQFREWDEEKDQDWFIEKYPIHDAFHRFIKDLNKLYLTKTALNKDEHNNFNFRWIESKKPSDCVYAFEVGIEEETILSIFNFSNKYHTDYKLKIFSKIKLEEIISSDYDIYGGTTKKGFNIPILYWNERQNCTEIIINLPPFSGIMYKKTPLKNSL